MPRKKKAVGVLKSLPIPERLQVDPPMPAIMKVSECLYILRPLFYCLFVTLCEETSYLPVGVSAGIDALSVILRMGYKRRSVPEIEELKSRNRELLTIYLFRKPIYTNFTRPRIIEPLVRKFIKWETIANMILQTIDFRTSYSLTL